MSTMLLARMKAIQLFSPAKVNLYLKILGRRGDGFHDLLSLVCPLDFGDILKLEIREGEGLDRLICNCPELPLDSSNLIHRAIDLFRSQNPFPGYVVVNLEKNIPMGAGLGGGSSNASATLWGLNQMVGNPFSPKELMDLSSELGSDCPLFLAGGASIMRGRGDQIHPLNMHQAQRLKSQNVMLLLPSIHVSTPWAYNEFSRKRDHESSEGLSESTLDSYLSGNISLRETLHNDFSAVVESKFAALVAARCVFQDAEIDNLMLSGSGSAMFSLVDFEELPSGNLRKVEEVLLQELGAEFGLVTAKLCPFFARPFNFRVYN